MTNLDRVDGRLFNLLQAEFPLTREPYADLGQALGLGEDEVLRRITRLKEKGLLRQIGPVLDARRLGYQTTLVAMRVGESQLERAEQLIARHPGVSHGYEREHYFNIWFTLAVPAAANLDTELRQWTNRLAAEAAFALPVLKQFKLRAYFSLDGDSPPGADTGAETDLLPPRAELSPTDRRIINELQEDLPLVPRPFADRAARLGLEATEFLAGCHSLLQRGIIRRFGAAVNHRKAGFKANAMTCWVAPGDMVDAAGRELALLPQVSHCYERRTNPLWHYNLFAMVHGHTREECQNIVRDVSHRIVLADYVMLFSTREFKKVRVKYLV